MRSFLKSGTVKAVRTLSGTRTLRPFLCLPRFLSRSLSQNHQLEKRQNTGWERQNDLHESFVIFIFIINDFNYSLSFSAVSRQYLCLVGTGLPRPGCGPLPGLCALLAAGLHDTCIQDECSHTDQRPPHGTRGHSDSQTGKGTRSFSGMSVVSREKDVEARNVCNIFPSQCFYYRLFIASVLAMVTCNWSACKCAVAVCKRPIYRRLLLLKSFSI